MTRIRQGLRSRIQFDVTDPDDPHTMSMSARVRKAARRTFTYKVEVWKQKARLLNDRRRLKLAHPVLPFTGAQMNKVVFLAPTSLVLLKASSLGVGLERLIGIFGKKEDISEFQETTSPSRHFWKKLLSCHQITWSRHANRWVWSNSCLDPPTNMFLRELILELNY